MAGDKTEDPTSKHLRDARNKGQVIKSQEIPTTAVVLAVFGYVWIRFDAILQRISEFIANCLAAMDGSFYESLGARTREACWLFVELTVPAVLLAALAGAVGHLAQAGLLFAWESATPSLNKLNPAQWFKKVFSVKNLVEFLRSVVKIAVIVLVFYQVFYDALPTVLRLPGRSAPDVLVAAGGILSDSVLYLAGAFAAIAAADWMFQRYSFLKEHRMSKEDVKNEYKEQEGDPQIKGQRKQLHQEMANSDSVEAVRKSDVLVTNPTHLAIAIEYKEENNRLPLILAKGEGRLAARMIKAAEEAGVPIMRNVPLAHDLWEQGQELNFIPSTLIKPVAEVLIWLRELKEKEGRP